MFRTAFFLILTIGSGFSIAQETQSAAPFTEKEKLSYALGANLARNLKGRNVELDYAMLVQGLKDAISGNARLTEQEIQTTISTFYNSLMTQKLEEQRSMADKNKKDGEAFLQDNTTKEGIITLADGLQYRILQEGSGPKPSSDSVVEVNYRGTLIDGTEFDSSYKRGKPAKFPVDGVIKGWTEALQLMPVGSKWQVFIPSELAYGSRQIGNLIGPNSTLIFEIELLSIQQSE